MSNMERIARAFRNGEAVIFAGAGMSRYAGCPMGRELTDLLLSQMSEEERNTIKKHDLPSVAQSFIDFRDGNRSELIELLHREYKRDYISTNTHIKVSRIPRLKDIITINYDYLFEQVYSSRLKIFYNDIDLSKLHNDNSVNLYKIHGDFEHLENLVLTKNDYDKFYEKFYNSLLFNKLIDIFCTNTIIFIGCNPLNENHIEKVIKTINLKLGNYRKPCYLVDPNVSFDRKKQLEEMDLILIEQDAESFVSGIYKNICNTLISDIIKQKIQVIDAKPILDAADIKPIIKKENYTVKELCLSSDGVIKDNVNVHNEIGLEKVLSLDLPIIKVNHKHLVGELSISDNAKNKLLSFLRGENVNNLILCDQDVNKIKLKIQEIKLVDGRIEDNSKLILSHRPLFTVFGEISNNAGTISDVKFSFFKFKDFAHIIVSHKCFRIDYKIILKEIKNFTTIASYYFTIKDVNQGINILSIILEHHDLLCPINSYDLVTIGKFSIAPDSESKIMAMLSIYNKMSYIEKSLNIEFKSKDDGFEFSREDIKSINKTYNILRYKALFNIPIEGLFRDEKCGLILAGLKKKDLTLEIRPRLPETFELKIFNYLFNFDIASYFIESSDIQKIEIKNDLDTEDNQRNVVLHTEKVKVKIKNISKEEKW